MPTVKLSRSQSYRITHTKGTSPMLGQRVRILLPEQEVKVTLVEGWIPAGYRAFVLSGKYAQSTVDLPACRLKAISAKNCRCSAYPFPHAPGLGKCKTSSVETTEIDPQALFANLGLTLTRKD